MVNNGCGHSFHSNIKFAVSQGIEEINWFFSCWYKFKKAESYLSNFWVGVVENGRGFFGHRALKSTMSLE